MYVTDQGDRCAVALPLPDNAGENVELYVEEKPGRPYVLLHDDSGVMLRFREAGYDWGDTPNEEKFTALLEAYGLKVDNSERVFMECDRPRLAECAWTMGKFLSEATQLANLARPQFRYNFRRAVRDELVGMGLTHVPFRRIKLAAEDFTFDFEIGSRHLVLVNALTATTPAQAKNAISRSYMAGSLLKKYRSPGPSSRKFTVTYDENSEIPESGAFSELADVLDHTPIPGSEFASTIRALATSA
ncbi:MAG TPA: hypothetical protein VGV89_01555 [Thermoplasmata archaeon]|nr:hypothetical protein [Thermoplasmata archaeon]